MLDIAGILDDAGISADQVTNLKFSGAEYFVTQVDPNHPNQGDHGRYGDRSPRGGGGGSARVELQRYREQRDEP